VTVVTHGKTDPVVAAAVVPKAHVEEVVEAEPGTEAAAAAPGAAVPEGAQPTEAKPAEKGAEKKEPAKEEKKK
jgi:hypothetical protein